jgi:hypothetical protein
MPGDLYSFVANDSAGFDLAVNGKKEQFTWDNGYVVLNRIWQKGDRISLSLPMPVRQIRANEQVAADLGRVALQRGPVVYCVEWPEAGDKHVLNLVLDRNMPLASSFRADLLDGVQIISGRAKALKQAAGGGTNLVETEFTAIPYYAWANRGAGEMAVWMAIEPGVVHPLPDRVQGK